MTEKEFLKEFNRLEGGFTMLKRDPESRRERELCYWMVLKEFRCDDFSKAVTRINNTWEYDHFPNPAIVKRYIEQEQARKIRQYPKADCRQCDGTGWAPYKDKTGARRVRECDCLKEVSHG